MKFAASVLLIFAGCGYQSQYGPPGDGRARVLWEDDHLTNNVPALPRGPGCHEATWWLRHPGEDDHRLSLAPLVWVPRHYGAALVPPPVPHHAAPSLNVDKELTLILLVAAIAVLPVVDVTFAALHPESDSRSADAIDEVNAYNDLARSAGNPCSQ